MIHMAGEPLHILKLHSRVTTNVLMRVPGRLNWCYSPRERDCLRETKDCSRHRRSNMAAVRVDATLFAPLNLADMADAGTGADTKGQLPVCCRCASQSCIASRLEVENPTWNQVKMQKVAIQSWLSGSCGLGAPIASTCWLVECAFLLGITTAVKLVSGEVRRFHPRWMEGSNRTVELHFMQRAALCIRKGKDHPVSEQ